MSESFWAIVIVAVVGLLTTVLAPIWHERRRWQHERRESFRDQRCRVYADYLSTVQVALMAAQANAGQRRAVSLFLEALSSDLEAQRRETEGTLRQAVVDLSNLLSVIRLIGAPEVVAAARAFTDVLTEADALVTARAKKPEDWQAVVDRLKSRRDRFVEAARAELNVPTLTPNDRAALARE